MLALLWKNKTYALMAVLAAALLALWALNADLRAQLADEEAAMAQLENANAGFKAAADEQNAAIVKLRMESEQRRRLAEAALKKASSTAHIHQQQAARIEGAPLSGDECQAAHALLTAYLKGK